MLLSFWFNFRLMNPKSQILYHQKIGKNSGQIDEKQVIIMTKRHNWSLVIGHWSFVIGHWSLVIGHSPLVSIRNANRYSPAS
jgi:hypothetical protein